MHSLDLMFWSAKLANSADQGNDSIEVKVNNLYGYWSDFNHPIYLCLGWLSELHPEITKTE